MMFTFMAIVIGALQTCQAFQGYRTQRPHHSFGVTEGKITTGEKPAGDGAYLHRRGYVVLLIAHLQVPRVDTAALLEKIADGERPFVIDNTGGGTEQLIIAMGKKRPCKDIIYKAFSMGILKGNYGDEHS